MILLISASQVAEVTSVRHWHPAKRFYSWQPKIKIKQKIHPNEKAQYSVSLADSVLYPYWTSLFVLPSRRNLTLHLPSDFFKISVLRCFCPPCVYILIHFIAQPLVSSYYVIDTLFHLAPISQISFFRSGKVVTQTTLLPEPSKCRWDSLCWLQFLHKTVLPSLCPTLILIPLDVTMIILKVNCNGEMTSCLQQTGCTMQRTGKHFLMCSREQGYNTIQLCSCEPNRESCKKRVPIIFWNGLNKISNTQKTKQFILDFSRVVGRSCFVSCIPCPCHSIKGLPVTRGQLQSSPFSSWPHSFSSHSGCIPHHRSLWTQVWSSTCPPAQTLPLGSSLPSELGLGFQEPRVCCKRRVRLQASTLLAQRSLYRGQSFREALTCVRFRDTFLSLSVQSGMSVYFLKDSLSVLSLFFLGRIITCKNLKRPFKSSCPNFSLNEETEATEVNCSTGGHTPRLALNK
jgi:hypothetical protein